MPIWYATAVAVAAASRSRSRAASASAAARAASLEANCLVSNLAWLAASTSLRPISRL